MTLAIGVDIGGTKVSAAYIADNQIVSTATVDYNRHTLVEDIFQLYINLNSKNQPVQKVGISCAGLINKSQGLVKFAGNLDLVDFPLVQKVSELISLPIHLDNDARCALWGEYQVNKSQLGQNVGGIIMGTGVGGGLIINGNLLSGVNGFAGEIGHMKVSFSKEKCACSLVGCLEAEAGGRSFETLYKKNFGAELSGKEIAHAAKCGNSTALNAFDRLGRAIGEVVAQLDNSMDLDSIVVGGGFGNTFEIWHNTAEKAYLENLVGADNRLPIKFLPATLGNQAGLLGAALLEG